MKQGLTKSDSMALKGIAILMLMFHHLFCEPERFEGYAVSFAPFSQSFVVSVASMFKICVSIFAFITGYGLYISVKNEECRRPVISRWYLKRLLKTLSGFWFIFILALPITGLINGLPRQTYFADGKAAGIAYIIIDGMGLANLFGTPTLCGTWWYMSAAIVYIIAVPVLFSLSRRFGFLAVSIGIIAVPRLFNVGYPGGTNAYSFLTAVILGMMCAEYNVFTRIEERVLPRHQVLAYVAHWCVWGLLIIGSYLVQRSYGRSEAWELNLGLIPLFFILFYRFCIIRIPGVSRILQFLGKHSMTIFLTHTFIRYTYCEDVIYGTVSNFIGIYFILLVLSVLLAVILDQIKTLCRYDAMVNKIIQKVVRS